MVDLPRELQTTLKTGKVIIGSRRTLRSLINGEPKLVIVSRNAPENIRKDVEVYAKLSGVPIYVFPGTSWDLGAMCNKPFMVSVLAILDPGESSILEMVEEGDG